MNKHHYYDEPNLNNEERLFHVLRSIHMSIDNLNASIARLSTAVTDRLAKDAADLAAAIASQNGVPQSDVDAAQASVDAITAQVAPAVS